MRRLIQTKIHLAFLGAVLISLTGCYSGDITHPHGPGPVATAGQVVLPADLGEPLTRPEADVASGSPSVTTDSAGVLVISAGAVVRTSQPDQVPVLIRLATTQSDGSLQE